MRLATFLLILTLSGITCAELAAQDLDQGYDPKKPVTYSGTFDLRGIGYAADGIANRRSPFSYIFNGNAELNIYGVSLPFSITVSDQQRDIRQPFNQFGISPKYKWVQLHLGYRNITFSPYTLAGYTMLGAGVELTPGKLRIGFMYGRLNKATAIDTTTGIVKPYSFSRKGYAVKAGYGTDDKNIEISYLAAQDDSNSVNKNIPDTLRTVTPEGNSVISLKSIYTFAKKLFVEVDGGASVYTYNVGSKQGPIGKPENIAGYLKDVVSVNASTVIVNATTQINLAYTGSVGYKEKNWSVKASYRHVDPEFQSMGAYFFQNDVESYTLAATINALKSRLRFLGSFGIQNDNLRQQKTATTSRIIGNANLSWDITDRLGIDGSYINFSANAAPSVVSVNNKYMLAQTTNNISVTPRYILPKENFTHVIIASYNLSTLEDHNTETSTFNNINTDVVFFTYSITQNKSGLTVSTGFNMAKTTFYSGTVNSYGGNLGVSRGFLKNKLQLAVSASYSRTDQFGAATVLNGGLAAGYEVTKHHKFSIRYNMLNNTPDQVSTTNKAFTEHTAEVAYILTL